MSKFKISSMFQRDPQYGGVWRIKIHSLRLVYGLIFVFVGFESWSHLITYQGPWDPTKAVSFCVWASYSVLSLLGIIQPLKLLPIMMLIILYKTLWLILIAYPLWSTNNLVNSPSKEMATTFSFVVLPILVMPWRYFFRTYIWAPR